MHSSKHPVNDRLQAALDYLRRGWSVLAFQPHAKRPLTPWRSLQSKHASADSVRQWFERVPDANVGLVTGAVSGLVVVDIDARHGGPASLAQLEAQHGPLPATLEAITGGGGRHLYFRHPSLRLTNRVGLLPGIDFRGDGGCIVAPPSIHPSGRPYVWVPGRGPGEVALAPMPVWLLDLARGAPARA